MGAFRLAGEGLRPVNPEVSKGNRRRIKMQKIWRETKLTPEDPEYEEYEEIIYDEYGFPWKPSEPNYDFDYLEKLREKIR